MLLFDSILTVYSYNDFVPPGSIQAAIVKQSGDEYRSVTARSDCENE